MISFGNKKAIDEIEKDNLREHEQLKAKAKAVLKSKEFSEFKISLVLSERMTIEHLMRLEMQESDPVKFAFTASKIIERHKVIVELFEGITEMDRSGNND